MYIGMTKIPRWSKYNKNDVLKFSVDVWKTTADAIRKSKYLIVTTAHFIKSYLFLELMYPMISSGKNCHKTCAEVISLYNSFFLPKVRKAAQRAVDHRRTCHILVRVPSFSQDAAFLPPSSSFVELGCCDIMVKLSGAPLLNIYK